MAEKDQGRKKWEMRVAGIAVDPASNIPVIVLRDQDNEHQVPIWIGQVEAVAIATELEGVKHARPMTHDLIRNTLEALGWTLRRVEICDLRDNTFFARLVVEREGRVVEIDSRPSDAVAVALRVGAPVFLHDHVLREARMDIPSEESEDEGQDPAVKAAEEKKKEIVGPRPLVFDGSVPETDEEWEELLKDLDPRDFGTYKQ